MEFKKALGLRIANALELRGKKQKELAQELEVTANTVSYFCTGSRTPNLEQLIKISEFLDVSTDYLLGRTTDPNIFPAATDDLGLSSDAINWITQKSRDPLLGKEFQEMFSNLLEMNEFQYLIDAILDYAASTFANTIDANNYQIAYHAHPLDINSRYELWESLMSKAEHDNELNARVRLFIQAFNELRGIDKNAPAFSSIWGTGENVGFHSSADGLSGISEARAMSFLTGVLSQIEKMYGIEANT